MPASRPLLRPRPSPPRALLTLEPLEDRLSPAVFNIGNGDVAGLITAINTANTNGQVDVINLAADGTYTMTAGTGALPAILTDALLTIEGHGSTLQRDTSNAAFRVRLLDITAGGGVEINDLTLRDGSVAGEGGVCRLRAEQRGRPDPGRSGHAPSAD